MTSLLAVDVGNSATKIGRFEGEALRFHEIIPTAESNEKKVGPALRRALRGMGKSGPARVEIALCSVVPAAATVWRKAVREAKAQLFVIQGDTPAPLANRYRFPAELGPDRLAAAVAAAALHRPVIVVSLGTATTIDAVSAKGEFLGGAICPGIAISLEALAIATAMLPSVSPRKPLIAIGKDTQECLLAGSYFGTIGQVNEIIRRQREIVGPAVVVVAGGYADMVAGEIEGGAAVEDHLTLEGIRLIWQHNKIPARSRGRKAGGA